jgi:hypothetical protein
MYRRTPALTVFTAFLCALCWICPVRVADAMPSVTWIPGPNLSALAATNPAAFDFWMGGIEDGFNLWHIGNDISLRFQVDFRADLGAIAGGTAAVTVAVPYADFRAALNNPTLPADPPTFLLAPSHQPIQTDLVETTLPNLKVLNLLPAAYSRPEQVDATIYFSSTLSWAVDPATLTGGNFYLPGVAAHEFGHAFGFLSSAENTSPDSLAAFSPSALDEFRFSAEGVRDVSPTDTIKYLSADNGATAIARFENGTNAGGNQASHFRGVPNSEIDYHLMNALAYEGLEMKPTPADTEALALIGYTFAPAASAAPESANLFAFAAVLALFLLYVHCRKRQ